MVDPVAILVAYLSLAAQSAPLRTTLAALSPSSGFDALDHIQGGNDLPTGWRVDSQGPVVMVSMRGGPFALEDVPLINASIVTQSYGASDEDAMQVARSVVDVLNDRAAAGFTFSKADFAPQVTADRSSEWRVGIVYFTVRIRNV